MKQVGKLSDIIEKYNSYNSDDKPKFNIFCDIYEQFDYCEILEIHKLGKNKYYLHFEEEDTRVYKYITEYGYFQIIERKILNGITSYICYKDVLDISEEYDVDEELVSYLLHYGNINEQYK